MFFGEPERAAISCVHVIPAIVLARYRRQLHQRIDYAGGSRAGNANDAARNAAGVAVCLDLLLQRLRTDVKVFVNSNLPQTAATKAEDVNAPLD